jgi:hypothetical protein
MLTLKQRRDLRQPARIVALNDRRRIMRARRSDASDADWKVLLVAAVAFGFLMAAGLLKSRDPEPCTVRLSINGRAHEIPGTWIETSSGPQCRTRVRG